MSSHQAEDQGPRRAGYRRGDGGQPPPGKLLLDCGRSADLTWLAVRIETAGDEVVGTDREVLSQDETLCCLSLRVGVAEGHGFGRGLQEELDG